MEKTIDKFTIKKALTYFISTIGVIGSILGFITIFYPSVFNMEITPIRKYHADEIGDYESYRKFVDFVEKQRTGEIFHLNVSIYETLNLIDIDEKGNEQLRKFNSQYPFSNRSERGFDIISAGDDSVNETGIEITSIDDPANCRELMSEHIANSNNRSQEIVNSFDMFEFCSARTSHYYFIGHKDHVQVSYTRQTFLYSIDGYFKLTEKMSYDPRHGATFSFRAVPKREALAQKEL